MVFAGILFVLFILELFYFKIAEYFNITDHPNERSSHANSTLRGGGLIFPLSVILYFAVFGFRYHAFAVGLIVLSIISFADDIRHQGRRLRAAIQLFSVLLLMYDTGLFFHHWLLCLAAVIVIMGMVNAYNFMDGINGMTACYSYTVIIALFFLNRQLYLFDEALLICLALGNLVFAYFNFRKNARCFAGDVGSVSMAYVLLFLATWCIVYTGNLVFVLFFTLYIVDVVLTIAHRLYKKENIFEPHRKHLFQYLANEKKIPQLWVSCAYMILQGIISAGVLLVWKKEPYLQWLFAAVVILASLVTYGVIKHSVTKKLSESKAVPSY